MNPVIYLRSSLAEEAEARAAAVYFNVYENRAAIPKDSLVIPRYSALPFYQELEKDMAHLGSSLINSWREHSYVADLQNWYYHLADVTPRTWFSLDQMPIEGPFVLKGQTNSRKWQWDTHMYAKDRYAACEVACRLGEDSMLGVQRVYGREYVELNRLATGLRGLPISEEYRFFILNGEVLASGFYWSSHVDDLDRTYDPDVEVPPEFIQKVVDKVAQHIPFFVVDVARTAAGDWIVVELNDGQQAGLSTIDPLQFYRNLRKSIER